jgi:hypothetical protein
MERFVREGGSYSDPRNPLSRWFSRYVALEQLHAEFEAGDGMALWEALEQIALHNFRVPPWVRHALTKGCGALTEFRAKSLDEAFGSPHEKSVNVPALRNRFLWEGRVYYAVSALLKKGYPRSDETFGVVAERFDIGVNRVKDYFYQLEKILDPVREI